MFSQQYSTGSTVLVVCSPSHAGSPIISSAKESVGAAGRVELIDLSSFSQLPSFPSSSCDYVLVISDTVNSLKQSHLFELFRLGKPGSNLTVFEPLVGRTAESSEKLAGMLTLAGFTGTRISNDGTFIEFAAQKPNWDMGSSQSISLKKKAGASSFVWKLDDSMDQDLLSESDLLSDADKSRPILQGDCEITSTKKACKNCTCGRAEQEDTAPKKKLTLDMIENPGVNSSCGNCALGDAFRCAGCPYRGLPAFRPGEKISLPDDFVMDDVAE